MPTSWRWARKAVRAVVVRGVVLVVGRLGLGLGGGEVVEGGGIGGTRGGGGLGLEVEGVEAEAEVEEGGG